MRSNLYVNGPDHRDGRAYVMTDYLRLAVNVALATARPLLLRGNPGSGKSSLAAHVAYERDWCYYEYVVTSRTTSQDILWSFDAVRRFADAPVYAAKNANIDNHFYVVPGVLWWAFDRESASRAGSSGPDSHRVAEPYAELNQKRRGGGVVVLIDEIDKADPDVPNGMLVALGSGEFTIGETGDRITRSLQTGKPSEQLIVITTNEERDLPEAFLRRCVIAELTDPDEHRLVAIAREHLETYSAHSPNDDAIDLANQLALEVVKTRQEASDAGVRGPSTAEYLDALQACLQLGISVGSEGWQYLRDFTLAKGSRRER